MATFKERSALTSRKYVSEPGMMILNFLKKLQFLLSDSSAFALEKRLKNLIFHSFFPLEDALVATFNETRAPTSRKYVAEQGVVMRN